MDWCEVVVHTTTQGAELVSDALMDAGATGTEIVDRADVPDPRKPGAYWELYDPKLIDDMPQDVLVKAWFERGEGLQGALAQARSRLWALQQESGLGALALETREVADQDWAENWKKTYKPLRVGRRLVIKPTWEPYAAQAGDLVVEMDPGMAFGTGTHETTAMCLSLLEKHLTPGMRVMDVGTGSGILAIAAALLGAGEVLAIDIDPDAVRVAAENIQRNGVEGIVRAVQGDLLRGESLPCELATANIVADAVCMLLTPLKQRLVPGGKLICSGIIRHREDDVLRAAAQAGYALVQREAMGEWVALCLKNGEA